MRMCVKKVEFQYGVDVFLELGFDFYAHALNGDQRNLPRERQRL